MSPPERLSDLLPVVVADLAARHHQPRPRLELDVTEQTLTDWCDWLRTDLLYRAPEDWPRAIDAWLRNTEHRFGERTTQHPRTWAAGLDDDTEAPRDLALIDREGDTWRYGVDGYGGEGWIPRSGSITNGDAYEWSAALSEAGALRESPVLPSGGER